MRSSARLGDWNTLFTTKYQSVAPLLQNSESEENKIKGWISAIENQDELFKAAIEIARAKIGFTIQPDYTNITLLNGARPRDFIVSFINDVRNMVQFNAGKLSTNNTSEELTPIEQFFLNEYDPLKLVHFPDLFTNTFSNTMASVLYSLRGNTATSNTPMTKILETAHSNAAVVKLLADQYRSNVILDSYYMTNKKPRGGFHMDQSIKEFMGVLDPNAGGGKPFFEDMITELASLVVNDVSSSKIFFDGKDASCNYLIFEWSWGKISAHIAYHYIKEGSLDTIFQNFKHCGTGIDLKKGDNRKYLPDTTIDTATSVIDGVPLRDILKSMSGAVFQYFIKLRSDLRKRELASKMEEPLDKFRDTMYSLYAIDKHTAFLDSLNRVADTLRNSDQSARDSALTALQTAVKALPNS